MPLTQKHRSSIFQTLSPILGEEEAEALLSEFPATEADELATKGLVRAEVSQLRAEMHDQLSALRSEVHDSVLATRADLHALSVQMHQQSAQIHQASGELHKALRQQVVWSTTAIISAVGLAAAAGSAF